MRLNPPKKVTFWIAVAIGLVGLIANFIAIPFLSPLAFWLVLAGFVVLVLGNTLKGF